MGLFRRLINALLRKMWTGQFAEKPCSHLGAIRDVRPASEVCEACVAAGDTWPALRMCLTCGYVGCCDKAKNRHAPKHFDETGHPIWIPYHERGMRWVWCRIDNALLDPLPDQP